jgi:hypothetical protein
VENETKQEKSHFTAIPQQTGTGAHKTFSCSFIMGLQQKLIAERGGDQLL